MKTEMCRVGLSGIFLSVLLLCHAPAAQAQRGAAAFPECVTPAPPATPAAGQGAGATPAQRIPRDASVMAIPGVVAAGVQWTKIWQSGGNSADGIVADKDGTVLVAQEDYDAVLKIDENGKTSVAVSNAKGVGSLSMDRDGRLYGIHRTERPGSTKPDQASIINAVTVLAPERRTVAAKWADGTPLSVRPNDLAADSHGGAYFTSGCVYYASANGSVSVVEGNIRTNGIVFSPDDRILYVTNAGTQAAGTIVAFDVRDRAGFRTVAFSRRSPWAMATAAPLTRKGACT